MTESRRLLRRDERRAQLVRAAAGAFLRSGYAATSLDDVAAAAGVTKVIIYRHFESKRDLYLAVLENVRQHLLARVGMHGYGKDTVRDLVLACRDDPDGVRLLFRHARREPEFAEYAAALHAAFPATAEQELSARVPDEARRAWLAALLPTVVIEAVLVWLDAGQTVAPDELTRTIEATTRALITGS